MAGIYVEITQKDFIIDGKKLIRNQREVLLEKKYETCVLGCISYGYSGQSVVENDRYIVCLYGEAFGIIDDDKNVTEHRTVNNAYELINIIEEQGIKIIERLNGAFVIAVLDKLEKKTVIYNDRFGIFPLYYKSNESGAVFAQDIKAFCQEKNLEPDYLGIAEYLSLDYCIEDRTMFKDIKYILPAQCITVTEDVVEVSTYWELPCTAGEKVKSKKDYLNELDKLYRSAVLTRKSDGKNVIGLSGGFDSRLILGILEGG